MQKRRVLQVLAAGLLLTLAAEVLMPRERLLSYSSVQVASLKDCVATDSVVGSDSEGYAWLSNDELLILRAKPQPTGLAQVEAFRHDVHTQRETPLADFNRRQANALVSTSSYPADPGNPYTREGLDNARLSPDRQPLLWFYGPYQHWNWHVARLDGTTVTDFKNTDKKPNFSCVNWLPDNRQWVSTNSIPLYYPSNSTALLDLRFYSTDPKSGIVKKTLDLFKPRVPWHFCAMDTCCPHARLVA